MKNISFALTTRQILDRTKTVTRRLKWLTLKPGDLLQGCKKCMGRKHGEPLEKLAVIRVVSVRREPLRLLTDDLDYGQEELRREGFDTAENVGALVDPTAWVPWFCASHKGCTPDTLVTRIEFEYVQQSSIIGSDLLALLNELPGCLSRQIVNHPKGKTHGFEMRLAREITATEKLHIEQLGYGWDQILGSTWIKAGNCPNRVRIVSDDC